MAKTVINLMRTFREVQDIVTFRIKEPIKSLQNQHGYDINAFLQSDDQVVPAPITEAALKDILPPGHIRIVAGGHNDLFFQEWQRNEFIAFLKEVRSRQNSRERYSHSE
jgi:putative intracellular protease/amidase